ncbi:hypothetical protein ACI3PL_22230, partial [Lacticaseibacillus paracasei]
GVWLPLTSDSYKTRADAKDHLLNTKRWTLEEVNCNNHYKYRIVDNTRPTKVARSHYAKLVPEPIEVISAWNLGYERSTAIKYISRAGTKD